MYLNPTLLLLFGLIFVFSPSIQEWVLNGNEAWYRPYIVWVTLIVFMYWTQRGKARDEY